MSMPTDTTNTKLFKFSLGTGTSVLTYYFSVINHEVWSEEKTVLLVRLDSILVKFEYAREFKNLESFKRRCSSSYVTLPAFFVIPVVEVHDGVGL